MTCYPPSLGPSGADCGMTPSSGSGPVMGAWVQLAACRGADTEQFFPQRGGDVRQVREICARCVVRAECADWALTLPENVGIWGGLSERQRRLIRRRMAAAGLPTRRCGRCYQLMPQGSGVTCGECQTNTARVAREQRVS